MKFSSKMDKLGSAIFAELKARKDALTARGISPIDLSVGSPDRPPAPHILQALKEEVADPGNYIYAISDLPELLEAVKGWYKVRFGVELDPAAEITSLIGSQDGLAHISLTIVDPGDVVLVPDPGYPIFSAGPAIAGAELVKMPMLEENGFLIDFDSIDPADAKRAKFMIVSYPNNPVTALATDEFYRDLIDFAKKYDIVVLHDNAYCELVFDGYRVGSFLSYPGAMDVGVEFNSLSKTYNMAGCRIGFAIGNREVIKNLKIMKSNIDYGIFLPIQKAGIAALTGPQDTVRETALAYQNRRDVLINGLNEIGWPIEKPRATMFVWAKIPEKFDSSMNFVLQLIENTGVLVTPGISFGDRGEGFVRMALVQNEDLMREAIDRIDASGILR
ncbi:MAG: aminotransferase class I/II-fold pyridoxal phosphate-dependent enzyme [Bacillota bacterium]|nr:aminotransferase class I/II-fold pyridoxal phosphate-dependent enzyme [Bacillota bacterium]